ncbi:unnamed protein product [marine sediment metagenome]|uniref:Uncharacterized protein n=1 Tax=marine sediment metagenome TaxID=412755 RepID=X1C6S2_9ZZZZ
MRTIILLCLITLSFAQTFDESDPREIIEKVRIYVITKELDITTEQAIQFFPIVKDIQKIDKEFREKKADALHELKRLLENESSDQEILKVITQYRNDYNKKIEEQKKKLDEIRKILTPVQQAKYLIVQERFEHEIREMIKKIKQSRQP